MSEPDPAPGGLPHNAEAERAVLGSILLNWKEVLPLVMPILSREDFFSEKHQRIYGGMLDLFHRSSAVDLLTLKDELNKSAAEAEAVDAVYFSWLLDGVPDIGSVEHYARIVKEKATQRRLVETCRGLERAALSGDKETPVLLAEAQDEIEKLVATGGTRKPLVGITLGELDALDIPEPRSILEPWLFDGDQPVVYGRRGVGKSFVTQGCASAVAGGGRFLRWRAPAALVVAFVDGEMMSRRLKTRGRDLRRSCPDLDPEGKLAENLVILTPDRLGRMLNLFKAEDRAAVERYAAKIGARFIVFDNIASLYRTDNPKLLSNLTEWWEPFQTWLLGFRARGIPTLTALHAGKDETRGPRGPSAIEDLVEISIKVSEAKGRKPTDGAWFEVEFTKTRDYLGPGGEKFEARLEGDGWTICGETATRTRTREERETRQRQKLDELAGWTRDFLRSNPDSSQRAIGTGLRADGRAFANQDLATVLGRLEKTGEVESTNGPDRSKLWHLREPSIVDDTASPGRFEVDG